MAALIGTARPRKFTTVCEVSLPGPAPIAGFAARPATSGASRQLTTPLCQQKSIPPSRPFAACLVLCSAETAIGLLLAARPASCACSPSNSKDASKSAPRNSPTAPASNPPSASARCDSRQARRPVPLPAIRSHQVGHDQCRLVPSRAAESQKAAGSLVSILAVPEAAKRSPKGNDIPKTHPSRRTSRNAIADPQRQARRSLERIGRVVPRRSCDDGAQALDAASCKGE